jgi:solute carrier family 7 (L-type amino acid transporter), member 6
MLTRFSSITTNNTAQSHLEPLIVQEELPHQDLDTSRHSIKSLRGPKGTLTFLNGLALIIGLQIGSGVFSSPAQVSSHVASPAVAICVWVVAGALVWTGASTLVEFATSISSNGGIEEYLRFCYGETAGFLFAWVWILIAKPCANALVSLILAEHLSSAVWPDKVDEKWINVSIALFTVIFMTLFNTLGTSTGARAANLFLLLKLMIAASIIIVGLSYGAINYHSTSKPQLRHPSRGVSAVERTTFDDHVFGISDAVSAVFGALFAYGGWENVKTLGAVLLATTDSHMADWVHCWRGAATRKKSTRNHQHRYANCHSLIRRHKSGTICCFR